MSILQGSGAVCRTFVKRRGAALAACFMITRVFAATPSAGEISVVAVHGDVQATMAGVTTPLYANAILQLPATILTGANGAIELRQGPTTIAAAANTELEIPRSAADAGLIERIVQIRGNAFYNVGKREKTRLRVETPYLVAVIKGTQFNVASQADATTIALFEGRLEVRAPDGSDVIDLNAGEIAIRGHDDVSIRMLRMTAASLIDSRTNGALTAPSGAGSPGAGAFTPADGGLPSGTAASTATAASSESVAGLDVSHASAALDVRNGVGAKSDIVKPGLDVGAGADLGAGGVTIGAAAGVNLGSANVGANLGAGVNLGAGMISAGADLTAGLGGVNAGANVGAGVDLGAGTISGGADITAGVGGVNAGANVGAGLNLGGDSAAVGVGADLGGVTVGADVGAGVAPDGGVAIDAGVDLTPVVNVDAGVDLSGGSLGVDLNIGGLNVGVGAAPGGVTVDPGLSGDSGGGLLGGGLGGLLRRDRR